MIKITNSDISKGDDDFTKLPRFIIRYENIFYSIKLKIPKYIIIL